MIDFRYHLVSIVAVFLALAIGIVLGATQLQRQTVDVLQSTSNSLRNQLSAASAERDSYQAQVGATEQFLQTAEPTLLGGRLTGQRVVLITEPGAASGVIGSVRQAATTAGATITGQIALQPKFNDISGATQSSLDTINGSIASSDNVTLTPGTAAQTAYQQQAAQLIAAAILTKTASTSQQSSGQQNNGGLTTASANTLLSAYAQGGYLTVTGSPTGDRATLAIVVVPASAPSGGQNDPVNQVLIAASQEFATASAATVVAGTTAGSQQQGNSISVLRASSASAQMSTVDDADLTLGQISVAEALASQLAGGKPNSYGISGASAVSPDPLPSPIATASPPQQGKTGKAKK